MYEIKKEIVRILQSDSQLQTLLGGTAQDKRIYPEKNNILENFPCIVYENVDGMEYTVPKNAQQSHFVLKIFSKNSYDELEQITVRAKTVMKYYASLTPRIFWTVKVLEMDNSDEDRLLFSKILRYTVWSNIV